VFFNFIARILNALGKKEAACGVYHDLLAQNSDSLKYLELLKESTSIVDENFYPDLRTLYPNSKIITKSQLKDSPKGML
jgi:hypothetical protein